jgi:hypothetical protein
VNYAMNNRKTHAGTFTFLFCGKEWIEYLSLIPPFHF